MSKTYFGITRAKGTNTIVGVVANPDLTGSRAATPEEVQEILSTIKPGATESLSDALRDGTYPNTVVVWDKRAAARAAIGELESFESPHFDYGVGEFGDKVRSVQPVLGWRLLVYGNASAFNRAYDDGDAGGERVQVDHAAQFGGDTDENFLFRTRELGRALMKAEGLGAGYELVPVYA